jgi:hypothetical protein
MAGKDWKGLDFAKLFTAAVGLAAIETYRRFTLSGFPAVSG